MSEERCRDCPCMGRIDSLRELMDERRDRLNERHVASQEALRIHTDEVDRRLDGLNNNHERTERLLQLTVSRELFDTMVKDIERRLANVRVQVTSEVSQRIGKQVAISHLVSVVALVAGVLSAVGWVVTLLTGR